MGLGLHHLPEVRASCASRPQEGLLYKKGNILIIFPGVLLVSFSYMHTHQNFTDDFTKQLPRKMQNQMHLQVN